MSRMCPGSSLAAVDEGEALTVEVSRKRNGGLKHGHFAAASELMGLSREG